MDTEEKKKFKKKAPWDAFVSSEAEVKYKGIQLRLNRKDERGEVGNET